MSHQNKAEEMTMMVNYTNLHYSYFYDMNYFSFTFSKKKKKNDNIYKLAVDEEEEVMD